ncbi:MAG: WbqC family protein [Flavobacteriales bacterium]|nr:WbqC family protein [Flavobacteriales bacterium]
MTVSIHQPHFLPWLGYFNKVWNSDVFVWLHNVQFRKNYFQNRTRIKNPQTGQPYWLTVPVHASITTPIDQVVEAGNKWRKSMVSTIEQFYRKTPFFKELGAELLSELQQAPSNLDRLNYRLFVFLLSKLNYKGKVIRVEELLPLPEDPNQRLVEICHKLGAKRYIAGQGGRNYLDLLLWEQKNIEIIWQRFDPISVYYTQAGDNFLTGLSIIDCLFNIGIDKTRELVQNSWKVTA